MKGEPANVWVQNHPFCEDTPCEECHDNHDEEQMLINYKDKVPCCVDHIEMALDNGEICKIHTEWLGKLANGKWWCDGCGEADEKYNGHLKPKGEK